MYLIRELFRITTISEYSEMLVLSDAEVNFYNLFFAFIAVIYSHSLCIIIWLDKPNSRYYIYFKRRSSIINDQRVLLWYFLSWFSQLAVGFGFLFVFSLSGYFAFSFFPDYIFFFILIIIVLYLQSWNTIRLKYKQQSIKWVLYSILIIVVLAFSLSRINLIDSKSINNIYLKYNIQYNYKLSLPESDFFQRTERLSLLENIYVVLEKDSVSDIAPIIIANNHEIQMADLPDVIGAWKSERDEIDAKLLNFRLNIHRDIKMEMVDSLRQLLYNVAAGKIEFAVIPRNREYDEGYYHFLSFPWRIPFYIFDTKYYNKALDNVRDYNNIIDIIVPNSDVYYLNDSLVNPNDLSTIIKSLILSNPDYFIRYSYSKKVDFNSYFTILNSIKTVIEELREEYALIRYSEKIEYLNIEQQDTIMKKVPLRILELRPEMTNIYVKE